MQSKCRVQEYGQGSSVRETGGLDFNLCVVPLPRNKGVLNLEQAEETEVGCILQR